MAIIRATSQSNSVDNRHYDLADFEGQKQEYFKGIQAEAAKILSDAKAQAQQALNEAKAAGLQQAKQEIDSQKAEAEKKGYEEGLAKGEAEAKQKFEESVRGEGENIIKLLEELVQGFAQEKEKLIQSSEGKLIDVAFSLAKKILNVEIKQNPKIFITQLKKGLEILSSESKIEIRVNPNDLEKAKLYFPKLQDILGGERDATFKADKSVSVSGCVISSGDSEVDNRIDVQWKKLIELVTPANARQG